MRKIEYLVYKITNKINGYMYIGQTTESLEKRFKRHCGYQLNDNTYLHRAMKKYGIENFSIELLETTTSQIELDKLEMFWISLYDSLNPEKGYNLKKQSGKVGEIHYPIIQTLKE